MYVLTLVFFGIVVPSAQLEECQTSSAKCYIYVNAILGKLPDTWIESGVRQHTTNAVISSRNPNQLEQ